ncbi:MAG: thioredoxin family protein [Gammaproteobacteria bacterium]
MKWLKLLVIIPLMLTPGSPWIMKWLAQYQSRKKLGRQAPDTSEVDGSTQAAHKLYYFHAPYCSPCQAMMPMIDSLKRDFPNLIKIDITQHESLAQAFGVSATPVFMVVDDGQINEVKVGSVRESWIRQRLTTE